MGLNRIEKVERKDADTGGTCSQLLGLQKLRKGEKKGCRHRRHLCRERYAENVPECASDYIANQHPHPPRIIAKQHHHPPLVVAKRHHHPPLIIAKGNDHI